MTIREATRIYMIGIKGVGMTALAEVLHGWGKDVTGSDTNERFQTDAVLQRRGITYREAFNAANIPSAVDLVIFSTAYGDANPEIAEAKRRGLATLSYPEALGQLMDGKYGIAVAGSHGKTTTTALLGYVMTEAGLDPTVIVGSEVKSWGSNARVGKSEYMVIEADEYQNKFQYYNPKGLIITNIDWDHPDFFQTKESYEKAFAEFRLKVVKSGGWAVDEFEISNLRFNTLPTALFGDHNKQNTAAVWEAAKKLGIDETVFWNAVKTFRGTARRFEEKGITKNGVLVIDDYAHHPTEIRATLKAARERFKGKAIWVVFHAHTFTRTKIFLDDFGSAFDDADHILVLDIYGSAREQHGGVHAKDIVKRINQSSSLRSAVRQLAEAEKQSSAIYTPTTEDAVKHLTAHAKDGDVVITIGAGDVWKVGERMLS